MKYNIYVKNKLLDWVQVRTYKGHDLMITQDGKLVCYIDGTRKVFPPTSDIKIEIIPENVQFDELDNEIRKIVDRILG